MSAPQPTTPGRAPRWARPALALSGLLFALVVAEGYARLRAPDGLGFMLLDAAGVGMEEVLEPHPERLWRTRPGAEATVRGLEYEASLRINSLGLRGPELSPQSPERRRLLVLGDSFTLAAQVEEEQTYAALLGERLGAIGGRGVDVLNAGVDGYGTQQATSAARDTLQRAPAQDLVLFFFLGNDFWENAHFQSRRDAARDGAPKEKKKSGSALHQSLARRSALYAWFSVTQAAWSGGGDAERRARYREELSAYTDPAVLEAWAPATRQALIELRDLCQRRRVRCAVAAIPPAFVVHDDRVDATFEVFGLDPAAVELDRPARALAEAMPGDLLLIDLTEDLRAAAGEGAALYFTYDGHLTPAGHVVVADAAAEALAPRWGRR